MGQDKYNYEHAQQKAYTSFTQGLSKGCGNGRRRHRYGRAGRRGLRRRVEPRCGR